MVDTVSFGSYVLTTDHAASSYGQPVLVERTTCKAYGVKDIFQPYPSWGYVPAWQVVERLSQAKQLSEDELALVDRFLGLRW